MLLIKVEYYKGLIVISRHFVHANHVPISVVALLIPYDYLVI